MHNSFSIHTLLPAKITLPIAFALLTLLAYGPLLLHPELHTACPENDTWNLPIRWSVLLALRNGQIPLWNPLSAFGIPWLATWQTECFYPGTLLFTWLGLDAWNYSGLLHLLIFSVGLYFFLRNCGVQSFWACVSASIALLNSCAYNHLGSNSSMDTMAWLPWIFLSAQQSVERKPWAPIGFTLFLSLQILAGYPQIIFYGLLGCFFYTLFLKGARSAAALVLPVIGSFFLTAAQWIPSAEYFFLNSVRLPAVHDNPHFFLPIENLKTFFDFNALAQKNKPDFIASPTFFYFNFYSGLIPLILLLWGALRFRSLKSFSRFFLISWVTTLLWSIGFFEELFLGIHISFPGFLEPAKAWVLINLFELMALGHLLQDLFPNPGKWKWPLLAACLLNLLYPIWIHPLESNLLPPNDKLEAETQKIKSHLGSGRILVLPNSEEHSALYTPLPNNNPQPLFKHFIANSNLFGSLPLPTFYGSTQPSWGALDAGFYFQYVFPGGNGNLLDLFGIDLIDIPQDHLPPPFVKIATEGKWTLWKNPTSLGSHFFFSGVPQTAERKNIFTAFASAKAHPLHDLFLDPLPISQAPLASRPPLGLAPISILSYKNKGFLIVTQNGTPGWRAWVDKKPVSLFLADGIFQCVPFQSGNQEVRLSYEPASFRIGLFFSLVSLGIFVAASASRLK